MKCPTHHILNVGSNLKGGDHGADQIELLEDLSNGKWKNYIEVKGAYDLTKGVLGLLNSYMTFKIQCTLYFRNTDNLESIKAEIKARILLLNENDNFINRQLTKWENLDLELVESCQEAEADLNNTIEIVMIYGNC